MVFLVSREIWRVIFKVSRMFEHSSCLALAEIQLISQQKLINFQYKFGEKSEKETSQLAAGT